jgi:hypothetical protein
MRLLHGHSTCKNHDDAVEKKTQKHGMDGGAHHQFK